MSHLSYWSDTNWDPRHVCICALSLFVVFCLIPAIIINFFTAASISHRFQFQYELTLILHPHWPRASRQASGSFSSPAGQNRALRQTTSLCPNRVKIELFVSGPRCFSLVSLFTEFCLLRFGHSGVRYGMHQFWLEHYRLRTNTLWRLRS